MTKFGGLRDGTARHSKGYPGADAGGIQQEKAGSPEDRASDCTKKEGLTMIVKNLDIENFKEKLELQVFNSKIRDEGCEIAKGFNLGLSTMFYETVSLLLNEYNKQPEGSAEA